MSWLPQFRLDSKGICTHGYGEPCETRLVRSASASTGRARSGAIPKSGDFDSSIRSLPGTTCDKRVEDPRSAFNFAGKIHLPTTVSGESSVSENLAPDALEN